MLKTTRFSKTPALKVFKTNYNKYVANSAYGIANKIVKNLSKFLKLNIFIK